MWTHASRLRARIAATRCVATEAHWSTLIACEQIGRRALAAEIEPSYAEVAIRRFKDFAGTTAHKIDG